MLHLSPVKIRFPVREDRDVPSINSGFHNAKSRSRRGTRQYSYRGIFEEYCKKPARNLNISRNVFKSTGRDKSGKLRGW